MNTTEITEFSQRLRFVRKTRELTQHGLAKKCGLQASAISHFETGNRTPCIRNLRILCEVLNVSSDYLLGL